MLGGFDFPYSKWSPTLLCAHICVCVFKIIFSLVPKWCRTTVFMCCCKQGAVVIQPHFHKNWNTVKCEINTECIAL